MFCYAGVIVDISHDKLDKIYQYKIPDSLQDQVAVGSRVNIPFGSRKITGYVVELSDQAEYDPSKIKDLEGIVEKAVPLESHLIRLAWWIKENYGSTMNEALKTVLPVKKTVKLHKDRLVKLLLSNGEAKCKLAEYQKKKYRAKERLLAELAEELELDYASVTERLHISSSTLRSMESEGVIAVAEKQEAGGIEQQDIPKPEFCLNAEQQNAVNGFSQDFEAGRREVYLLQGVTGSGKTEVYLAMMQQVIAMDKQVIFLIPEIALTYQTVKRIKKRFGSRVAVMNSRLSAGERYEQYERAKRGEIDIMLGPRSALFTPFMNLGLIILDEEHEGSYKSEKPPKYHAREVAIERARQLSASVVLGSATPSLDSAKHAAEGSYRYFSLSNRAGNAAMPEIHVTDLREEMKAGNRSIFGRKLRELLEDRLTKGEQSMLFLNRRGYAGFVTCRSCGFVVKCPHCDVSLTYHSNKMLICHYCGFKAGMPEKCPSCTSPYIAPFGVGTQKVEEMVLKEFPNARVLRMDTDTTAGKGGHEKILSAFADGQADILVGTQMIVKGHDFEQVTLVGILAADMSLYANDFMAAEKTYQLLVQAGGRAGRGNFPGAVVIQTYHPEHYSIMAAAEQSYASFYRQEMQFRRMMKYPPVSHILAVLMNGKYEERTAEAAQKLAEELKIFAAEQGMTKQAAVIGPAPAQISKINDIYRMVLYLKASDYKVLVYLKNHLEQTARTREEYRYLSVQFDFDPMNSY